MHDERMYCKYYIGSAADFRHRASPALGIQGAALATGLGQTISAAFYLIIYLARPVSVHFRRKDAILDATLCKKMYSIGIPATLNMALPSLLISALNMILAGFSQTYVFVLGCLL